MADTLLLARNHLRNPRGGDTFMTFKQFTDSWWFWLLCVATILVHGYLSHWDWITWSLLGYFAFTACMRIVAWRRRKRA